MADNLGTLEYDMLIREEKLDKQLADITKKLQAEDKKWKEILSGSGNVATPKINVTDLNTLTKANEAIARSNVQIKSSIAELKAQIKENTTAYEALSEAERKDVNIGGQLLKNIQTQKDQLNEYNKMLRENIVARNEAAKAAVAQTKMEQQAQESLESQRSKAFVKSNLDEEKKITKEIKDQESALRSLEAQRSRAYTKGELEKEKQLTREIKAQQDALRSLEAQRSRAFVAQGNKDIRDRIAAEKQLAQEERLRINIEAQEVGSIARLRAENALYTFQISKLNPLIEKERIEIVKLAQAKAANNAQIQNLQPTINAWGKLVSAIKTYATAYLSVQGIITAGRAIYTQTKELDQLGFSMKTVIQNTQELANTQKFLSGIAINYGGDLLTLSERYIKFRAAAIQSNVSASETQKIFDSVSKAAGTLGLKTDELSGVYLALEQMLSKGKVTTEELRRQLGERLPGAFGIMANALGVTIPELDKLLKKGQILSAEALPKFAIAVEKAYGIENVKKIDTLAAAQGRMSTQFTELIRSMQASDSFKNIINGIADFLGFIRNNISTIAFLAKSLLSVATAVTVYKISIAAAVPIQRTLILLGFQQTSMLVKLSAAQLAAAETAAAAAAGTTLWARAWNALKVAFVSNPIGVIVTGLTLIGTALYMLVGKSKDATKEVKSFYDNLASQKATLEQYFNSLEKAGKKTYEYKDALFQINNLYGKYLPNLLTEKSSLDEVTKARKLANDELTKEMYLKEQQARLEQAAADRDKVIKGIEEDLRASAPSMTASQLGRVYARILDVASIGELNPDKRRAIISKAFTGDLDAIEKYVSKATMALEGYKATVSNIYDFYAKVIKPPAPLAFNPQDLKNAKAEFEELAKLQKVGGESTLVRNYSADFASYKEYLMHQLVLYKDNTDAKRQIYLELAEIEKKGDTDVNKKKIEHLQAQLTLLEKMKTAYDKLRMQFSEKDSANKVLQLYVKEAKDLNLSVNPILNTENFNAQMEAIANIIEKYDTKIAQSIRAKIAGESTDQTIEDAKNRLELVRKEIDAFDAKSNLQKKIFEITGDKELSIRLSFGVDAKQTDLQQLLRDELTKLAKSINIELPADLKGKFFNQIFDTDKIKTMFGSDVVKSYESLFELLKKDQESNFIDAISKISDLEKLYGSSELKKQQIHTEFQNKIKELDSKYFTGSADEKAAMIKNIRNAESEAIAEVDSAIFASTQTYKDLYSDFSEYSISKLKSVIAEGQKLLDLTQGQVASADKKIHITVDGKDIPLTEQQIFSLTKQIEKLSKELQKDSPFEKIHEGLRLLATGDAKNLAEGLDKINSGFSQISSMISPILEQFGNLAEATGNIKLTNLISDLQLSLKWTSLLMDTVTSLGEAFTSGDPSKVMQSLSNIVVELVKAEADYQKKKKEFLIENIQLQQKYNNLVLAERLLFTQGTTIFGSDKFGGVINGLQVYKDALQQQVPLIEKLKQRLVIVGTEPIKFLGITIGQKNVYASITSVYPDLIDAEGKLNVKRAEAILLSKNISEETKGIIQNLLDLDKTAQDAYGKMTEYLTNVFGSLGQSLSDAIVNAFENGTDASLEFKKSVTATIESLVKDLMTSLFFTKYFNDYQKKLEAIYSDTTLTDQQIGEKTIAVMNDFFNGIGSVVGNAEQFLGNMKNVGSKYGFDLFNPTSTTDSAGISKGIQAVTEDTARRLEGLINSIRESGVINIGNVKKLVESNQLIQGYAAESLGVLRNIDMTTSSQLKLFNEIMQSGGNGKGMKVYVQ